MAGSKRGMERRELLWTGSAGARSRGLGAGCGSRRQTGDTPGQHALAEHHQIEKDEEAEVKLLHLARPIEQHGIPQTLLLQPLPYLGQLGEHGYRQTDRKSTRLKSRH